VQVSLRKILVGTLASAALSVPAIAEVKIGVVDYARLIEQSPQAKALQDSLKNEFGPRYQQLLAQDQQLKARADKLQKDGATMSQEQRDKEEKSIRDAARDLERPGEARALRVGQALVRADGQVRHRGEV